MTDTINTVEQITGLLNGLTGHESYALIVAGLDNTTRSALRESLAEDITRPLEEFRRLVASAEALQADAERLCDEANESGTENDEMAVRGQADDRRAEALRVAVRILGTC